MKRILALSLVAAAVCCASATDMDNKAKVIGGVVTMHSGVAEITCDDKGPWNFSFGACDDDGRDVVTVKITSPTNAMPPRFGVFFRVPGAGVQNVWTSDCSSDSFHLWPQLWWGWKARYH